MSALGSGLHLRVWSAALCCLLSVIAVQPRAAVAAEQSVRGAVQALVYNRAQVKTSAGRVYDAELSGAVLQRKNGLPMTYAELAVGDVVEMTGTVWPDASMTVTRLRNVSLYPHAATFTGKVLAVDVSHSVLTFQSSAYGEQRAYVGPGTLIHIKHETPLLERIVPKMTVTVKGTWERTRAVVVARSIQATYRLLNVSVTGAVVGQLGTDLTVVADGVIYAVHTAGVAVRGLPSGQPLSWLVGRTVKVDAKHLAESLELTATRIRVVTSP